jgi:hypothetical protein
MMRRKQMKKKYCIIVNLILLMWFFLDMIGVYVGDDYLVTRSYREDGIFFICFLVALILFVVKEQIGKYTLSIWLLIWLIAQFLSHEWFTFFGNGEGRIRYFKNAIHWVDSSTRYIPDVYHTVLHLLIVIASVVTLRYCFYRKGNSVLKLTN